MKKKNIGNEFGRFQFKVRFFFDSFAILFAWSVSYYIRFFLILNSSGESLLLFLVLGLLAWFSGIFFLNVLHLYEARLTSRWRREIFGLFLVSICVFLTFVVVYYFVFYYKISRLQLLLFWYFLILFLIFDRRIVNRIVAKKIYNGKFKSNVLLVGNGTRLIDYQNAVESMGRSGRIVISGLYSPYSGSDSSIEFSIQHVNNVEASSIKEAVEKSGANIVVINFREDCYKQQAQIVKESLDLLNQRVFLLPSIPKTYVGVKNGDFHDIPVLELNSFNMTTRKAFLKRFFDIVSCSLAVVLLFPLFLFLAFLVKISSKGPVFYKQKRVTVNGKVFTMLKFRSMRIDMKEKGEAHWTEVNDPRITKIGKFLRRTSLDELPQFFNVIQGSMSLIGPRPERPELEQKFIREIPGYYMRHRMKAGISGWAQVNGLRGNTSLEKRVEYDLAYIRNWSFLFDMKIIFLTFFKGFVNKNAY